MQITVHDSPRDLGAAAAHHAAQRLRALANPGRLLSVMFATGASQLETLRALTRIHDLPWDRIAGFHMDEYIGLGASHPASFRRYLRDELASQVPFHTFHFIDGSAPDTGRECRRYAALLNAHPPQLCLAGIGENGHLAFNDPPVADFNDPDDVKIVELDRDCRQQQVNEAWFPALKDVPTQAITVTIPALTRIPELILSVPGERKRAIVERTLSEEISTRCPATILRRHPNARLYLDRASRPPMSCPSTPL